MSDAFMHISSVQNKGTLSYIILPATANYKLILKSSKDSLKVFIYSFMSSQGDTNFFLKKSETTSQCLWDSIVMFSKASSECLSGKSYFGAEK